MAITSCGQQPGVNNINADVLVMELVASQSYGDILTDTLIISNILTEGVNASGKPRIKVEQLHYLLAGALASYGFEVTQECLQLAWEGLCVSPYVTAACPDNLRAWTFFRLPQEAVFNPHGSSEGHPDPRQPDPFLLTHWPYLMVSKLFNWEVRK